MGTDMCIDMCEGMCLGMRLGMCLGMHLGMCLGMRLGMCMGMCIGICIVMRAGMFPWQAPARPPSCSHVPAVPRLQLLLPAERESFFVATISEHADGLRRSEGT